MAKPQAVVIAAEDGLSTGRARELAADYALTREARSPADAFLNPVAGYHIWGSPVFAPEDNMFKRNGA
jgi:hypothetical protein